MQLPKIFKNFYFVVFIGFVLWIIFFDSNDLITQFYRNERLKKLSEEKSFYNEKINKLGKDRKSLSDNPLNMEKFAREKYFFKKPKEDIYVIEEEKIEKE